MLPVILGTVGFLAFRHFANQKAKSVSPLFSPAVTRRPITTMPGMPGGPPIMPMAPPMGIPPVTAPPAAPPVASMVRVYHPDAHDNPAGAVLRFGVNIAAFQAVNPGKDPFQWIHNTWILPLQAHDSGPRTGAMGTVTA